MTSLLPFEDLEVCSLDRGSDLAEVGPSNLSEYTSETCSAHTNFPALLRSSREPSWWWTSLSMLWKKKTKPDVEVARTFAGPLMAPRATIGDFVYYIASCVFLLAIYYVARKYFESTKQRCWILTAVNSLVTPILAFISLFRIVGSSWEYGLVAGGSRSSRFCMIFFVSYLTCELVVGYIDYRKHVTLIMGYIHHITYLTLCLHLITKSSTNLMAMMLCEELPTLILAVGRLSNGALFRSDLAFSVSFVITRVLFHLYVQWNMYRLRWDPRMGLWWLVCLLAFVMNVYWLLAWWQSVQRRRAKIRGQGGRHIYRRGSRDTPPISIKAMKTASPRTSRLSRLNNRIQIFLYKNRQGITSYRQKFRLYRKELKKDLQKFARNRMRDIRKAKRLSKEIGNDVAKRLCEDDDEDNNNLVSKERNNKKTQ